jgi:hypothetical protein
MLATSPVGYRVVAASGGRVIAATSDGVISELDPRSLQPTGPPFPGTNGYVAACRDNEDHADSAQARCG